MQSEELPGIVDTERLESFNPSPGLCQHPTQGSTRSFPSNIPIDHVSQGPAFQKVCPRCRGDMSGSIPSDFLRICSEPSGTNIGHATRRCSIPGIGRRYPQADPHGNGGALGRGASQTASSVHREHRQKQC
eukprot:1737971-Rhodomonas_salina.2